MAKHTKKLRNKTNKKRGGCSVCGSNAVKGGCSCMKGFFGANKKKGGSCGCNGKDSGVSLNLKGGNGNFQSPLLAKNIIPLANENENPLNPEFIKSERLLGGRRRKTARRKRGGKRKIGGDIFLGRSAPSNMVLNAGTTVGSAAGFNTMMGRTNINGSAYSQPVLQ
jgi:hypothetical protein